MELITPEQARLHCRADVGVDEQMLDLYGSAAEQAAQNFLNRRVYPNPEAMASAVLDGSAGCDPMVVNDAIRAAILLMLGHLYRNREAVVSEATNELPLGVTQLLWPHRVGLGV